jgi:hypothetical protein
MWHTVRIDVQELISLEQATKDCSFDSAIVKRFLKVYDIPAEDAHALLVDVKQLLWISHKRRHELQRETPILYQQYAMDEMWHNFILFTKEYTKYCESLYGHYLHHTPAVGEDDESISEDLLRENLLYIEKHLGLEVVNRWYIEWPEKYSKQTLISKIIAL